MARGPYTTANYFLNSTAAITAVPLTISCWVRLIGTTPSCGIVDLHASGSGTNVNQFLLNIDGSGFPQVRTSSPTQSSNSGGGTHPYVADGTWHHIAGVWISSTSRRPYSDGVAGTSSTTSRVPSSIDQENIGRTGGSTPGNASGYYIADVAIWNIDLTAQEILTLSQGRSPLEVRSANLCRFWPLDEFTYNNNSLAMDKQASTAGIMVAQGPINIVDHPPVLLPPLNIRRLFNLIPQAAATSAIKTINDLAKASVKTVNDLAIASVKTINDLA